MLLSITRTYKKINIYSSIQNALFTVLISLIVYFFYNIEFIRAHIEDFAFDVINELVMSNKVDYTNSPNVFLFKVDYKYLAKSNMIDENNETTYGYLFSRSNIAKFIQSIDGFTANNPNNCPKALFIDFDLSYPGSLDGKSVTKDDKLLLNTLKKDRCYSILLPKIQHKNFIEFIDDPIIQTKITKHKIEFVSTGLTESGDKLSRRYYPYEAYKNRNNVDKYYISAPITMWNMYKKYNVDLLKNFFHQEKISLIENRIIFKDKILFETNQDFEALKSNWSSLSIYSTSYPIANIPTEKVKDSLILYGSVHNGSNDKFTMDSMDTEISGVEMQSNALMTLFYLNGNLKRLSLVTTVVLVFFIVLFTDIVIQLFGVKWNFFKNHQILFLVIVSTAVMFFMSIWLMLYLKVWFNWLIPSLLTMTTTKVVIIRKVITKISLKDMLLHLLLAKLITNNLKKITKR